MPFGYVAFYGIGAYTTGVAVKILGLSVYAAIPLAGVTGIAFGLLVAPTLRLSGIYFAIVSLSLAIICQRIVSLLPDDYTGGSHGIILGVITDREHGYYAMLLVLVAVSDEQEDKDKAVNLVLPTNRLAGGNAQVRY